MNDSISELLQEELRKGLLPTSTDEAIPLPEIIENYRHLFGTKGPIHIEKQLLEALSEKEFSEAGLLKYYPRIYRGLPRIYQRENPANSHIKKNFSHLPTLKKLACEKAIFSLYEKGVVEGKVVFFTWIISDGLGDYFAAIEVAQILKERFSSLDLHFVALVPQRMQVEEPRECQFYRIPHETEIPDEIVKMFRQADLILQMPTFYPHTTELKERIFSIEGDQPFPRWENLGEYGFLESSWFHPKTGNRSLGLHFLEKGILIRKSSAHSDLKNLSLKEKLFEGKDSRFFLAYLATPIGGAVYLHALLKWLEKEERGIDLCTSELKWFIDYVEMRNRERRPVLEESFGVGSIEVHFQNEVHQISIKETGKKVRILCTGPISNRDFRTLLARSGEFVAIRGDQSFSDAVSENKVFFYDGREHARYFVKDLLALAENRLSTHPSTLSCFRGMGKTFLHNIPSQEEKWVDETFFQEKEDWFEIARQIGTALQNSDAQEGFKKFNRIIAEELSCNEFLCHLVQRAFCHRKFPMLESIEEEEFSSLPFPLFVQSLKKILPIGSR